MKKHFWKKNIEQNIRQQQQTKKHLEERTQRVNELERLFSNAVSEHTEIRENLNKQN